MSAKLHSIDFPPEHNLQAKYHPPVFAELPAQCKQTAAYTLLNLPLMVGSRKINPCPPENSQIQSPLDPSLCQYFLLFSELQNVKPLNQKCQYFPQFLELLDTAVFHGICNALCATQPHPKDGFLYEMQFSKDDNDC